MKVTIAIIAIAGAMMMPGCKKDDNSGMNNQDREFLDRVSYGNHAAIDGGKIAIDRGSDGAVKSYGQLVLNDHTADDNELKKLATARNYNIPGNSDVEHQAAQLVMKGKSGREFDSMFVNAQVYDHIQLMGICQDEVAGGMDQGLKNYASAYMAQINAHKKIGDDLKTAQGY